MSFIGPGSEWFWTALSGIVLAITFLAIYRQLRLQRSAGAIEQIAAFTREWNSERLLVHRRSVLVALRDVRDRAVLPDGAASSVGNYWEGVAGLVRAGHLDRELLWNQYGTTGQAWWSALGPYARVARDRDNDPTIFEDFEWLVGRLDEMDRRAKAAPVLDLDSWRDRAIVTIDGMLAVERSLRRVLVESPETPSPDPRPGRHPTQRRASRS